MTFCFVLLFASYAFCINFFFQLKKAMRWPPKLCYTVMLHLLPYFVDGMHSAVAGDRQCGGGSNGGVKLQAVPRLSNFIFSSKPQAQLFTAFFLIRELVMMHQTAAPNSCAASVRSLLVWAIGVSNTQRFPCRGNSFVSANALRNKELI